MKDILQKLSTYNIFNYLLPGIVFVALLRQYTSFDLIVDELLIGAFLYYFIGMIISRIGSIVIEPILRKSGIVKFSDYPKFVLASKKDDKIELFSEINNTYRTLISMLLILLLVVIYENIVFLMDLNDTLISIIGLVFLTILFLLSYRKQTEYINKRIDAQNNEK
jgi:hypothetical protein